MSRPPPATVAQTRTPEPVGPNWAGLAALFFFSGALGLVYEVLWQRQFALLFGSAAPATAAVLAAYFAGLGAGGLVLGAAASRWTRPLRTYAVLEALVGIGALLVTPLSNIQERLYPWLFNHLAGSPGLFVAAKMFLAFLALAIPTFCMGGTLPVLGQLVDQGRKKLGTSAGMLYVANTAGAGLGALSVPFLLLPVLGARGSLWLCVAGNLCVGLVAWRMDRWVSAKGTEKTQKTEGTERTPQSARVRPTELNPVWKLPVLMLSFISGLVTFVLQVLWNRAFAQVHENSVYSFAVIGVVFILALAIGGHLARVGLRRGIMPERMMGWAWLAGGLLVAMSPWLFVEMTHGLSYLSSEGGWSHYALRLLGLAAVALLLPITCVGVAFPVLMEQAGRLRNARAGDALGQLLAINLAGSVAGALMAGFLLPRLFGFWTGILMAATVLAAAGAWQFPHWKTSPTAWQRLRGVAVAATAGVLIIFYHKWPAVRIAEQQGERLVAISEGTHGIVAVVERPGSRRLKLNNHYALGGTSSTGDERMQAHVPLLLHRSPRRVAVLGLGTGITAGGASFHPVEQLTLVELVPEVIAAARQHFSQASAGILDDARTRVVVDDARSYLRGTSSKFDVIVGDLVVPWRQGEGALFTLEHFTAARKALAPGGLFCQWLPLFQLSEAELFIVLRTFLTVFPTASLWRGDFSPDQPALAIVGGVEPFILESATVQGRIRELRTDPSNPQLAEPVLFWMHFAGVLEIGSLPAGESRINREDRPWVELIGPMQHAGQPETSAFTGRRLQTWLHQVKQQSAGRVPALGEVETAGSRAGDLLQEFALSLSERNQPAAQAAQTQMRGLLSESAYRILFPAASP